MTQHAATTAEGSVAAGQSEAGVVHRDETVAAFMDLSPVTRQRERSLLDADAQAIRAAIA